MRAALAVLTVGLLSMPLLGQTAGRTGRAPEKSTATRLGGEAGAILARQCVSCHGPEKKKGSLDLSRRDSALAGGKSGVVIVPGEPDASLLVERVTAGEMPPRSPLGRAEVAILRAWVEASAPYPGAPVTPLGAGRDWWSLQPIGSATPPESCGVGSSWVRTPVDAFLLARLKEAGLAPAAPLDRARLIRRVTFDLTGLPPTPEDVAAFLADDSPAAYEALVDRLLASPRYGERWGRHWLDVVRFGESQGYETNMPRPSAWPYRDYVIRAFNRDTPFARFVFEQLAGDDLSRSAGEPSAGASCLDAGPPGDWLTQAATGFLVGGTHDIVGNQTIEGTLQQRADDLDDMIAATGTAFLGLTVQCARCHDHKFDPITQKDYYGLQAIFAGVQHGERELAAPDAERSARTAAKLSAALARVEAQLDALEPLARTGGGSPVRAMVGAGRNVERFAPVEARMVRLTIRRTNDSAEPCVDEIEVYGGEPGGPARNLALAAAGGTASASSEYAGSSLHKIIHLNDGRFGNSRSWISRDRGAGQAVVAWPQLAVIDRVVWGRDRDGVYRDRLATEYELEAAREPGRWTLIASSRDRAPYRSGGATASATAAAPGRGGKSESVDSERAALLARQASLRARLADSGTTIKVYAGSFSQAGATHVLVRGDPTRPGPQVQPSGIEAVGPALSLEVGTPEAVRRARLAQWIAGQHNPLPARVMVNRLWLYHFGRGIVATPSDFGWNGGRPSHPELLDWLAARYRSSGWRLKPIHRMIVLSAAYRQSSALDARADRVDHDNRLLWRMTPRRLEAEAIRDAILATSGQLDARMGGPGYNIWEKNTNYVAVYRARTELGPGDFRRMVYQFKPRSQPDPTFGAFDCPDAAMVAPRRSVSTTALQALNLLNSRFVFQQSARFAARLEIEAGHSAGAQAARGFLLALGRSPSVPEMSGAVALIEEHGTAAFCRALYNAAEFIYLP
jgi:mono/diheme cytochrome c family protein